MIVEGLVTTLDAEGAPHLAPMGPRFDPAEPDRFLLRPFPTAQTCRNLLRHPQGVFHITDDALLLAQAAIGRLPSFPPVQPAARIRGVVLQDCCRYYEFVIEQVDTSQERVHMQARIVHQGRVRDFLGFQRARHAIVEAAILATRVHLLPREEIYAEFRKLWRIVEKTGDAAEHEAMALLEEYVRAAAAPVAPRLAPLSDRGSEPSQDQPRGP
jgi:hypothetical protein